MAKKKNGKGHGWRGLATHCKRGHEFTPENIKPVKGGRACRECLRMHNKKQTKKRQKARLTASYW